MLLVAFFLLIVVPWQPHPFMAGPYTISQCFDVREYLERRGYEVSGCEFMAVPQEDAVQLKVPYIPTEEKFEPQEELWEY